MGRPRRPRSTLWLAALSILLLAAAEPGELSLRFAAPAAHRPVSGETRVALAVTLPEGSRLLKIDLFIDDQHVATLEKPPFEIVWNAGPEFLPHRLRAVATDTAGNTASAVMETPPLRIGERESVALVNLFVNAFDEKGEGVSDLRREEFRVFEDGVPQEISHFTAARQPLSIALLIDSSNSMGTGRRMEIARKSAAEFVHKMQAPDRLLVMSFSDTVKEIEAITGNRKRLEKAILGIEPEGGTALYDALVEGASRLKDLEGRKALVLLSDGRDQALKENTPGSLHLFEEALDAVVRGEVTVYAIGLGARLEDETDLAQRHSLKEILETLSEKTGGRFYNPERPGQLADVYRRISEDLSRQYSLAYSPLNGRRDGRWRTLRVEASRPGVRLVTRPGYFAPAR
ncbi:MAG TPA: VWA domain-containing protein [Candidatus Polarisedimenticolia bacterium]|jgi:VWFA-related protein|nr:VWA domain-containing protein [Candidatus Polarisedimenticolia bacterium]